MRRFGSSIFGFTAERSRGGDLRPLYASRLRIRGAIRFHHAQPSFSKRASACATICRVDKSDLRTTGGSSVRSNPVECSEESPEKEACLSDRAVIGPEPASDFRLARMLPTLLFDVALPIVMFNVLTRHGIPALWALAAGALSPAINNLHVWLKSRRLEPLGIIVMVFLVVGTAVSLLSGSVFVALIKDSFVTGTFGTLCLASLLAARPLMFVIVRQFVAGDDPARLEWWNGLWQYPQFRSVMRFVTTVWGIVYLVEAMLRVSFALLMPPAQVVVISPVMGFGVLIMLIAWTRRYMLAYRARRLLAQQGNPVA
jgi:hypothetical protein